MMGTPVLTGSSSCKAKSRFLGTSCAEGPACTDPWGAIPKGGPYRCPIGREGREASVEELGCRHPGRQESDSLASECLSLHYAVDRG